MNNGNGKVAAPRVVFRMATGGLVWALPGGTLQVMWAGPGSRLAIGWPLVAGSTTSPIEHPSADGVYMTAKEARAALVAFLRAG